MAKVCLNDIYKICYIYGGRMLSNREFVDVDSVDMRNKDCQFHTLL